MKSKINIANAPCSWGVLEFDLEGETLGYAQVLDEIAETGYTGTELGDWGFMPTVPRELYHQIQQRQLALLGAFVPVKLTDRSAWVEGIDRAIKTAGLMHDAGYIDAFIVLADDNGSDPVRTKMAGRITTEQMLTPEQYLTMAEGAESVATSIKARYGMRTVFHHHGAGYVETPAEIELLLQHTDPDMLGLCFDTGHFRFGGGTDVLGFMKKHYDRIWHVHFKDYSPAVGAQARDQAWDYFTAVKNGIFCELGQGDVPFAAVKSFLIQKDYPGWIVVEQDVLPGMGKPKLCALKNRQYLHSIGL